MPCPRDRSVEDEVRNVAAESVGPRGRNDLVLLGANDRDRYLRPFKKPRGIDLVLEQQADWQPG